MDIYIYIEQQTAGRDWILEDLDFVSLPRPHPLRARDASSDAGQAEHEHG